MPYSRISNFYFYGNLFFEYDDFDFNVFLPRSILKVCNKQWTNCQKYSEVFLFYILYFCCITIFVCSPFIKSSIFINNLYISYIYSYFSDGYDLVPKTRLISPFFRPCKRFSVLYGELVP